MAFHDAPSAPTDSAVPFPVLDSVKSIVEQSQLVAFHPVQVPSAVAQWGHLLETHSSWQHPCHFLDHSGETVRWIFVLDILNHCFWPDSGAPVWAVVYQGETWSGYWALAASLKKAMERGYPITRADYLENIPEGDLRAIFSGVGEIPLLPERLANLREAGAVLRSRFGGDILGLLETTRGSAVRTVLALVEAFPSFRDEAYLDGKKACFWKRAQIFAADLYHAFAGRDWGAFGDIERLTAFADYKLPQVLRCLGVISYHPELAHRVDQKEFLPAGSAEEVEIRAATIWAAEALREEFRRIRVAAASMHVDQWLWQLGQMEAFRHRPYHRCRTIFY